MSRGNHGYDSKYDGLIDAQTWAFIQQTDSWYPPNAVGLSVADQRAVYDRMCAAFFAGYPAGITATDSVIELPTHSIPLRHYVGARSGRAQVVYLHGGGFVVGGLNSHDDVCAEICAATGFDVLAVDYRLSPEHPFPQDFEDALVAFRHIAASGTPTVLVGDSAGGNLSAAVAAMCRDDPHPPVGQVLIYPGLGGDDDSPSRTEHAAAPMLTAQDTTFYADIRSGGDMAVQDNPSFSPLRAGGFDGLPPTVVISAECDPLASDGAIYCAAIQAAGGTAWHREEEGLVHGYLRARHSVDRAAQSFDRITRAISALGQGQEPQL